MAARTAAANAKLAQLRKNGGVQRVSRAVALRAYLREHAGVDDCVWPDKREAIDEFKASVAATKGTSLKDQVQHICFECVGGGADPAPKLAVRDCPHRNCPLRPIRPWQELRGRAASDATGDLQI